jgi:predicted Zn-dependent protease
MGKQNVNPDPGQIKFLLEASQLMASKGKYLEACDILQGVISLIPHRAIGYTFYGDACMEMRKFDDAIKAHQKAVELEPENTFARVHLGEVLLIMKQREKGLEELRKVQEADPNGADGALARSLIKASATGVFAKV